MLQDKPKAGAFTFQVTLHQNGDIVFVYSVIPLVVEEIQDTMHPVKVGLSDAYIMDRTVFCECPAYPTHSLPNSRLLGSQRYVTIAAISVNIVAKVKTVWKICSQICLHLNGQV
jgi:hypothetical protein